jgi:hypothetical protein
MRGVTTGGIPTAAAAATAAVDVGVREQELERATVGGNICSSPARHMSSASAGTHPQARDRLLVVVEGLLLLGCRGDEEAGVEPTPLPHRGDPVVDQVDPIGEQQEVLLGAQVDERSCDLRGSRGGRR